MKRHDAALAVTSREKGEPPSSRQQEAASNHEPLPALVTYPLLEVGAHTSNCAEHITHDPVRRQTLASVFDVMGSEE